MAKNDFLKRQAERNRDFFDAGERVGMQKVGTMSRSPFVTQMLWARI